MATDTADAPSLDRPHDAIGAVRARVEPGGPPPGYVGRHVCSVAYTHYRSDPRVRREAEALRWRGDHVTVLALHEAGSPLVDDVDGVTVIGLPVERHRSHDVGGYLTSYGRFFARAAAHLTRHPRRYAFVHVHSLPEAMVFAAFAPKLARRPVVLDVHDLSTEVYASRIGTVPAFVRWAERLSLRFADRVVTVHDDYRDRIIARGVRRDAVTVVLNTPDDRVFPLLEPVTPKRPPTLIYHGTIVERYGLGVAVRAMAEVRHRIPGVRLELIGGGDFRPELARLVAELELEESVHLSEGSLPVDAIPDLVRAADVGVVPFVDDPFTRAILPTKLLEYVRMGRPVIVSRNPVIERYFGDEDVYFVEPGDVSGVALAIEQINADPTEAAQRATRAQRFFDEHAWPSVRANFLALTDEVAPR
ncbi:MAG TPA: glycosyltransferase family 4 protein [Acidimicrobiales bacterium]|jgi:glycosyltransferase involved in cell wall biosynthesis